MKRHSRVPQRSRRIPRNGDPAGKKGLSRYFPWLAGIILVNFVVLFIMLRPEKIDPNTLCPLEPVGKTVLLIDVSDSLSSSQKSRLDNELKFLGDTSSKRPNALLSKGEELVVYFLQPEPNAPELLFAMCHPGEFSERTFIDTISTGEMFARKKWEMFQETTANYIDQRIDTSDGASTSPIYEALQYIRAKEFPPPALVSTDHDFKLLIWSDMIQNSSKENHFRATSSPEQFFKDNPFQMDGVTVELMFLISQKYSSNQSDELIFWWRKIFALSGARLNLGYQQ